MFKIKQPRAVELPRLFMALIFAAIGFLISLIVFATLDTQSATFAATIATSAAVVVALAVGIIPWHIAQEDRKVRSTVIASRIAHDLQRALTSAPSIRSGLGYVAETANARNIIDAAKTCLPTPPATLDENFEQIGSLPQGDASVVCVGAMAAIAQYEGVFVIANADLEGALAIARMEILAHNDTISPSDLEDQAYQKIGHFMKQVARHGAARAIETQAKVPAAIEVLRRHGAIMHPPFQEFEESPIPEVAAAVKAGIWPTRAI